MIRITHWVNTNLDITSREERERERERERARERELVTVNWLHDLLTHELNQKYAPVNAYRNRSCGDIINYGIMHILDLKLLRRKKHTTIQKTSFRYPTNYIRSATMICYCCIVI